jgi:hypothetical protein
MTWKSTAVAGVATITATWLASYAPPSRSAASRSNVPTAARTEIAAAEIQREADRLHARLAEVGAYRDPARNPFRFGVRQTAPQARRAQPRITIEDLPSVPEQEPPTLRLTLAGIAEDKAGEEIVRTAIISTPSDVLLVKVGDAVGDRFTVAAVGVDTVELVRTDTGESVRLMLKP